MSTRVLLAGILGGIAMFVWTTIAHMVLPLGEAGFREIPDEQSVVGAMNSAIGDQAGFIFFQDLASALIQLGSNEAKQ
jgi:predicted secreted protein